jgi:hypothetical protein
VTSSKVLLVLGSGATAGGGFQLKFEGALWKPPLDLNFFETPLVQKLFTEEDFPASYFYREGPGLEALWSKVDLYNKLCRSGVISESESYVKIANLMDAKAKKESAYRAKLEREDRRWRVPDMAVWELRTLIRTVFEKIRLPSGDSPPLYLVIDRLRNFGNLAGIINFNYDLSLEGSFGDTESMPFYYPTLSNQYSAGKLPLFKLHGSLNWQTDSKSDRRIRMVNSIAEIDHTVDWYKQPEMIGPNFFKQEISLDFNPPGDFRVPFYKKLWSLTWDVLKTVSHLVFIGFSFPPTDSHAAALFRTAHLSGSGFQRVILCHLNDSKLKSTAQQVFSGRPTELTEFSGGLEDMATRLDELIKLLSD